MLGSREPAGLVLAPVQQGGADAVPAPFGKNPTVDQIDPAAIFLVPDLNHAVTHGLPFDFGDLPAVELACRGSLGQFGADFLAGGDAFQGGQRVDCVARGSPGVDGSQRVRVLLANGIAEGQPVDGGDRGKEVWVGFHLM